MKILNPSLNEEERMGQTEPDSIRAVASKKKVGCKMRSPRRCGFRP